MGTMKRGRVVAGRGSQVKVVFEDSDGVVSPWLDVAQSSTIGKRSYRRFKTGELVRCYLDRKGESGEALYAIYNDDHPAPADSDDVIHEVMPDGSTLVWQPGKLTVTHASGITLTLAGGKLQVDGDLVVTGGLEVQGDTSLASTTINGVTQVGD
ncbi:hypothetical protein ACUXV3_12245 [Roseobacteraceae bacterium NS-SX3]